MKSAHSTANSFMRYLRAASSCKPDNAAACSSANFSWIVEKSSALRDANELLQTFFIAATDSTAAAQRDAIPHEVFMECTN